MKCPKCGYQQASGETCIECEIIFSRYCDHQERIKEAQSPAKENTAESTPEDSIPISSDSSSFMRSLFALHKSPWNPVSAPATASISFLFAVLFYLLNQHSVMVNNNESIILYLLHQTNLVFHEAGHVIFGIFGRVIKYSRWKPGTTHDSLW